MSKNLTKPFLLILVALVIVACYFIFRPFLTEIFVAAILASVFYTPYLRFAKFLHGRKKLAASLMCILLLVIIILPTIQLLAYTGQRSVVAYNATVVFFNEHNTNEIFQADFFNRGVLGYLHLSSYDLNSTTLQSTLLEIFKKSSNWLLDGATMALKGTTDFVVSLILVIIAMFFFFVDGQGMLKRLMRISPLPDKYDQTLFLKFRAVSYATFISTFVAAVAQGLVGAIGFAIIGFPALLAGILVALLSLLPYIGAALFYVPMGIYYLLIGNIWQGIFILIWGTMVISTIDNVIRTYMVKGEAEINPIFVLFSILGGVVMFGFWGVVLGPLVVALAVTVFHIYELEFCDMLEDREMGDEEEKVAVVNK
ncbi:AI-2E family transporter [Candidatus Falkowbacteria bacterium]|uniref:AI-2E family transporter n=1 Tax=Candidatus Falkowbacteria bacterium CG10_big_fil_rev_8_21_14_0_10_37_18 TaxID=1974562 RepID=A0A2H0V9S8_9BACT|nr:AI-2E family transporter [Candidatus Falkowbacteria bacterium]NCQ13048.1 AI-2E family transporter [Candidatus Falkowbacteria bacterium]OIO06471.1 MAG: hypothetical protein AUJ26_00550 [Candidatus Falkowbacteria bacterium CG1_02_37_21]PIR95848.1 MAG: hypothetical protein COT93_00210 [Candidatus Falkowbacteria bacterium CG10_big_fil_rev_8_21_14_0_10_37_18]